MVTSVMRFSSIVLILFFYFHTAYSQNASRKNALSFSIPVIWNNSKAVEPLAGVQFTETGDAISYGGILKYSRTIAKEVFIVGGFGIYRQCFGVKRKCDFDVPGSSLHFARNYKYLCTSYAVGIGYLQQLPGSVLQISTNYTYLHSISQKYAKASLKQVNHEPLAVGHTIDLTVGLEKRLSNQISFETALIVPFINSWKSDSMLLTDGRIGTTNVSAGLIISFKYHFGKPPKTK